MTGEWKKLENKRHYGIIKQLVMCTMCFRYS
jgi:hypothetical protein